MNKRLSGLLVVAMLLSLLPFLVMPTPASAATTSLTIIKYASDNTTVLAQTTVTYQWMEANLPVLGDGTTHYYHQGPVFIDNPDEATEQALRWNPAEDTNVQNKDMGAVKGTNVKDLCNLVGGMSDSDRLKVKASDGLSQCFGYKNVYEYSTREGPMGITWYMNGNYPDTGYSDGMRLVWFADTSVNPWGIHAFGNYDWHEAADPEYWYYYYASLSERYPTTTGLSVKYVSQLLIYSNLSATHTITASAGANGTIDPSGEVTVNYGASQSFTITPNAGYHVAAVLVDGASVGVVTSYTFTNMTANHTILASFAGPATQAPVAAFTADVTSGVAPLTVNFRDESTENPTAWEWDFNNDGEEDSAAQNPSCTYSAAGTYTVKLTTTNDAGSDSKVIDNYITVTAPLLPVADFTADVVSGTAPLTVNFTDQSTGKPTAWAWDFNNDSIVDSDAQNPSYAYDAAGTYTVKLTVANTTGSDSKVKADCITVVAPPLPAADFTADVISGTAPLTVNFTDQSTGNPTAWAWDFDNDGAVDSAAQDPTYTYDAAGTYTVKLTVSNLAGSDSEVKTDCITVTAPSSSSDWIKRHYIPVVVGVIALTALAAVAVLVMKARRKPT